MRGLVFALVLCGCMPHHSGTPPGDPQCAAQVTLDAMNPSRMVGPFAIDTGGVDVCLVLDATLHHRAHFAATTAQEPGSASSFADTLEDAGRAPVLDGWDVTIGTSDPHTFLNLEWDPSVGQVTTMTLWVHARAQTATTTINVSLIDPLD